MSFSVTFDDSRLISGLEAIQLRLRQMRPVLEHVADDLLNTTRARFDSETGPDGQKWVPLSPRYAKAKAKKYGSAKILTREGLLRKYLSSQVTDTTVTIGNTSPYARIHQLGGRVTIPGKSDSVRLRTDRKGRLLRQTDSEGKPIGNGKLAVFANPGHRLAAVREYVMASYTVDIPARPYIGLSDQDYTTVAESIGRYLTDG